MQWVEWVLAVGVAIAAFWTGFWCAKVDERVKRMERRRRYGLD